MGRAFRSSDARSSMHSSTIPSASAFVTPPVMEFSEVEANNATPPGPTSGPNEDDPSAIPTQSDSMDAEPSQPPIEHVYQRPSADIANEVHTFVRDYIGFATPGIMIDQVEKDRHLRDLRLKQLDPEVLAATMWGSFKTIGALFGDPVKERDESEFKLTCLQLMPFFEAVSKGIKANGWDQYVQIMEPNEAVSVEADFIIFNKADFLRREHLVEQKYKALSLDRAKGYRKADMLDSDAVSLAHSAQDLIRLSLGQTSFVQAPFPAHLLRDSLAIRRFEVLCCPGTVLHENPPHAIRKARRAFGMCGCCGGYDGKGERECRKVREAERLSYTTGYTTKRIGNMTYFVPDTIADDFAVHASHYELVYPGALFLFGRIHPTVAAARLEFRLCPDCGLTHKITFPPVRFACPYNLPSLAQRFVKEFHQYEIACTEPMASIDYPLDW